MDEEETEFPRSGEFKVGDKVKVADEPMESGAYYWVPEMDCHKGAVGVIVTDYGPGCKLSFDGVVDTYAFDYKWLTHYVPHYVSPAQEQYERDSLF